MPAVTTLKGHVSRALDFYNKDSIYYSIGKTTPWGPGSAEVPPIPVSTDDTTDVFGYKHIESKFMVIESDQGQLVYRNQRWLIVDPSEALAKGARWVYVKTYIDYGEFSTSISYRQLGIYTNLRIAPGVTPGTYALYPDQVADPGILEVLDNRTPIYRDPNQKETLVMVIEF